MNSENHKTGIIYLIRNTVNGKIYVGLTRQKLYRRWTGHKTTAMSDYPYRYRMYLHKAMRKYGTNAFTVEVLETLPLDQLSEAEIRWIAKLRTTDPAIGYNSTPGGDIPIVTETSRKRMSEARRGRFAGANHPRFGVKLTVEERKKLSDAHIGVQAGEKHPLFGTKRSPETLKKIRETKIKRGLIRQDCLPKAA